MRPLTDRTGQPRISTWLTMLATFGLTWGLIEALDRTALPSWAAGAIVGVVMGGAILLAVKSRDRLATGLFFVAFVAGGVLFATIPGRDHPMSDYRVAVGFAPLFAAIGLLFVLRRGHRARS